MEFESEPAKTFKERPDIKEIRKLVAKEQFLDISSQEDFELKDIDPKSPSGHWNFLVEQGDKKFVLRMVGDEKPVRGNEIEQEYNILKHVASYDVAPKPYYFSNSDYKEPFLLEEFLDGKLFTQLDTVEQGKELPKVAELAAKISAIPITDEIRTYLQPINNYDSNFQTWDKRMAEVSKDSQYDALRFEIEKLLPEAKEKISKLEKYLMAAPESFVFKSAHAGHCVKTKSGLRFLNWEESGYGDPSYSLAVFLASIRNRPDFGVAKETMIKSYLAQNNMVKERDFRVLLDTRLFERLVSDTTWPVWIAAIQKRMLFPSENSVINARLSEIKNLLSTR